MYSKTCILCQRTSLKRWFGNRTMTSNCYVTNSAQQIQMTTLCHWMKPPHENFLRTPLRVSVHLQSMSSFAERRSCVQRPQQSRDHGAVHAWRRPRHIHWWTGLQRDAVESGLRQVAGKPIAWPVTSTTMTSRFFAYAEIFKKCLCTLRNNARHNRAFTSLPLVLFWLHCKVMQTTLCCFRFFPKFKRRFRYFYRFGETCASK